MSAWMYVAGWVLVHFLWQGTALALATAVVLRLCRNQSPSARYAIACGAMAAMLVAAGSTAAFVQPAAFSIDTASVSSRMTPNLRVDVVLPIEMSESVSSGAMSNAWRIGAFLSWIVSAWLMGVIVLLARATAGWWCVRRLHRLARASMCSDWQAAADRIASRVGLASVVHIVELPNIDVPLVIGWLRPIIVLPIAAISHLNATQVEAIIAHEMAHVRRHDCLVNLMQTVAETLLFYHPAIWWLSARIRDEREHCCDDVAVAVCGDPVGYAAALAELEAWRSGHLSLATAATDGSLVNRVRRILRVEVSDDSRISPSTLAVIVAAGVGALTFNVTAQTLAPTEPNITFEVASVRENRSGDVKMHMQRLPGGRVNAVNMPLDVLLRNAYRLQESQLVGAPDWVFSTRYDIKAKAAGEFPAPIPGEPFSPFGPVQAAMRSLLEERFRLVAHRETRELPIYALVRVHADGKLGPQLKVSAVDCAAREARDAKVDRAASSPPPRKLSDQLDCGIRFGIGELSGRGFPLSNLAQEISGLVQRIVVDRTGLSGNYEWVAKFTPERIPRGPGMPADQPLRVNGGDIDSTGPSIFTAVQEQLGLKLESTRGPVEVLVIDRIERPTPD